MDLGGRRGENVSILDGLDRRWYRIARIHSSFGGWRRRRHILQLEWLIRSRSPIDANQIETIGDATIQHN